MYVIFFLNTNKKPPLQKKKEMTSIREYVKRYHVASAIKQLLLFIERKSPKLLQDIEHYSFRIVIHDLQTTEEEVDDDIPLPYPGQFEALAESVVQRAVDMDKELIRYRTACTKAEDDIRGYKKIIATYSTRKKYLRTVTMQYHQQLQLIKMLLQHRQRFGEPDADDDSYGDSYSPVRALYENDDR